MKDIYCHKRLSRERGGMPGSAPFENPMWIKHKNMNVNTKSIDNTAAQLLPPSARVMNNYPDREPLARNPSGMWFALCPPLLQDVP